MMLSEEKHDDMVGTVVGTREELVENELFMEEPVTVEIGSEEVDMEVVWICNGEKGTV